MMCVCISFCFACAGTLCVLHESVCVCAFHFVVCVPVLYSFRRGTGFLELADAAANYGRAGASASGLGASTPALIGSSAISAPLVFLSAGTAPHAAAAIGGGPRSDPRSESPGVAVDVECGGVGALRVRSAGDRHPLMSARLARRCKLTLV